MADTKVTVERLRPDGLDNKPHFNAVVTTEGGRLIHVSGMTAVDANGDLVGASDLAAQAKQTFENIRIGLAAAGATPSDVVRQRIFIVNLVPEHRTIVGQAMQDFYGDGPRPSSTAIGIPGLLGPGAIIEIDVTAAIDA